MSPRIVLYSADICPYAHRARIALKASGAKFEIVEIDLKNKPEWYAPNVNPASKVPALSYGAPEGSDVSKPPAGTFILPESALNVGFVASLYPQIDYKDPVTRAKSNLLALQYDNTVSNTWRQLQRESSGDDESIKAFLDSVKALTPYIDDALLGSEYGVGGILLAPFVTRIFIFAESDIGSYKEGTGKKVLDALSAPEYAKFLRYADKLRTWDAVKSTVDEAGVKERYKAVLTKKE